MTNPAYIDPMSALAAAPLTTARPNGSGGSGPASSGSWFQKLAKGWGEALDHQADLIASESDVVGAGGGDSPSVITQLTADTLKMGFLAQSSQTSTSSAGNALETLARKQ
jgi:hypothetical protein